MDRTPPAIRRNFKLNPDGAIPWTQSRARDPERSSGSCGAAEATLESGSAWPSTRALALGPRPRRSLGAGVKTEKRVLTPRLVARAPLSATHTSQTTGVHFRRPSPSSTPTPSLLKTHLSLWMRKILQSQCEEVVEGSRERYICARKN